MNQRHLRFGIGCLLAAALLLVGGCQRNTTPNQADDPNAGKVQVLYGSDGYVWTDLQEGVPASTFTSADFSEDGQYRTYCGTEYEALAGIDVSEHQMEIDWAQAAQSGVEFAMIRAGYRGSTTGGLYIDEYFHENMSGAVEAGVEIGVYFFSQATTRAEASAEAHYLLALLENYKGSVTMPVVFDWEETGMENARTAGLPGETITACAETFCNVIREAGYTPAVYFNRHLGYYFYDFSKLLDNVFWFAGEGSYPDFYYQHSMWQYSFNGTIPGIPAAVDLDLYLRPVSSGQVADSEGDGAVPGENG